MNREGHDELAGDAYRCEIPRSSTYVRSYSIQYHRVLRILKAGTKGVLGLTVHAFLYPPERFQRPHHTLPRNVGCVPVTWRADGQDRMQLHAIMRKGERYRAADLQI